MKQIYRQKKFQKISLIYLTVSALVKKTLQKKKDIEEEPFETVDIVAVSMNNDYNEFRQYITSFANKGNKILQNIK